MTLITGKSAGVEKFVVLEARTGHYELYRNLPNGGAVYFSATREARVLQRAASWLKEQARRKDGGQLGRAA